jgi:hypothetical protein
LATETVTSAGRPAFGVSSGAAAGAGASVVAGAGASSVGGSASGERDGGGVREPVKATTVMATTAAMDSPTTATSGRRRRARTMIRL